MYKLKLPTSILFTVFAQRVASQSVDFVRTFLYHYRRQFDDFEKLKETRDTLDKYLDDEFCEDRNWEGLGDEHSGHLLLSMGTSMSSDFGGGTEIWK